MKPVGTLLRVALILAVTLTSVAVRADDASRWFLWEQANARMAAARTPDDFLAAARAYHELVNDGVRNGPLFFNLGTALLLAGDSENAAVALRRAERYAGSTPEIRTNLRQALALQSGQTDAELPWDYLLFFWHHDAPLPIRAQAALGGWLLLWVALLLRLWSHPGAGRLRAFANAGLLFGVLTFSIFLASVTLSWLQEQADDRGWSERVFAGKTIPEAAP